jgi:dolichol-phosphate mannosyltransferase
VISEGISVVTTTWNERESIEKLVLAVRGVLSGVPHEVIVVDDSSSDGTLEAAKRVADVAVGKKREGQTVGLLFGMRMAKYPVVVTIDADLENDPACIPELVRLTAEYDVVVASRTKLPRFSEKLASKTLGKIVGVCDSFSNYRAYRKEIIPKLSLKHGETFGAEILVVAKKQGLKIGEMHYAPPPRRKRPRIGGKIKANLRILWASVKATAIYLF